MKKASSGVHVLQRKTGSTLLTVTSQRAILLPSSSEGKESFTGIFQQHKIMLENEYSMKTIFIINLKNVSSGVPAVAQQVGDTVLSLWQCGFNPRAGAVC